jgi:hypothetical protein
MGIGHGPSKLDNPENRASKNWREFYGSRSERGRKLLNQMELAREALQA